MTLADGYLLAPSERRKATSRSEEVSMEGLRELVDDVHLGPAARTAIECVEKRGADPRLMLLLLEKAQEGFFSPDKPERDRQRYAQNGGGS